MTRQRLHFLFLNIGHFYDHLFMLVFATVAALALTREWGLSYAALIPYATPGFVAFGVCAIPAGWLADKWSREGMMAAFFLGIGACSVLTGLADSPLQIAAGLLAIGVFGAIYHPVGIAMVIEGREKTGMAIAVNGVWGNLGVGSAALISGFLIDVAGWRAAFVAPGVVAIATGLAYIVFLRAGNVRARVVSSTAPARPAAVTLAPPRATLARILVIVMATTAIGSLIFQSTTFALPKIFAERLSDLAGSATEIGTYAFVVFTVAAVAQLVVGWLVDRYSLRTVFAGVAAMQAVFLMAMARVEGMAALIVSVCFMLAVFGQVPINDVLLGRVTRSEWRSRVFALRFIIAFSVMASAVPLLAWIYDGWGFATLFILLGSAAAVTFAAVLLLPSTRAVTGAADTSPQPAE